MISDGFDLASRRMAGGVERFAFQADVKGSALFPDHRAAPDEIVSSEKLEQFRQQVMH